MCHGRSCGGVSDWRLGTRPSHICPFKFTQTLSGSKSDVLKLANFLYILFVVEIHGYYYLNTLYFRLSAIVLKKDSRKMCHKYQYLGLHCKFNIIYNKISLIRHCYKPGGAGFLEYLDYWIVEESL